MQVEKKKFYEQYAICTLDVLLKGFSNFQKGESPDYFNESVGLEITRAISTAEGEIDAFFTKYCNKFLTEINQEQLKKLGFVEYPSSENGIYYQQRNKKNDVLLYYKPKNTDDLLLCAHMNLLKPISSEDIRNAVDKKIKKLNSNYCVKPKNDLVLLVSEQLNYICNKEYFVNKIVRTYIEQIKGIYDDEKYTLYFDNLYLIFWDNLFVIDTKKWTLDQKTISQENLNEIYSKLDEY